MKTTLEVIKTDKGYNVILDGRSWRCSLSEAGLFDVFKQLFESAIEYERKNKNAKNNGV